MRKIDTWNLAYRINKYMAKDDPEEYEYFIRDLEGTDPVEHYESLLRDWESAEYLIESFDGHVTRNNEDGQAIEILKDLCALHHMESEALRPIYNKREANVINCFAYRCLSILADADDMCVDESIDEIHAKYREARSDMSDIYEGFDYAFAEDDYRNSIYLNMVYASAIQLAVENEKDF